MPAAIVGAVRATGIGLLTAAGALIPRPIRRPRILHHLRRLLRFDLRPIFVFVIVPDAERAAEFFG
jgi:hypothetical protein